MLRNFISYKIWRNMTNLVLVLILQAMLLSENEDRFRKGSDRLQEVLIRNGLESGGIRETCRGRIVLVP